MQCIMMYYIKVRNIKLTYLRWSKLDDSFLSRYVYMYLKADVYITWF